MIIKMDHHEIRHAAMGLGESVMAMFWISNPEEHARAKERLDNYWFRLCRDMEPDPRDIAEAYRAWRR